jgi:hypothetical protein
VRAINSGSETSRNGAAAAVGKRIGADESLFDVWDGDDVMIRSPGV